MNYRTYNRSITLVLVALMVVLAGCSGDTTADAETTTTTAATTTTETPTTADTTVTNRQFDVKIINTQPNSDGSGLQNFDLEVTVDTRMPNADADGSGEPALAVEIDSDWITETQELPQKQTGTYTVQLEQKELKEYSGTQTIRVELIDKDVFGDDLIDVWEGQANFGAKPKPTPTSTPVPKSTTTKPSFTTTVQTTTITPVTTTTQEPTTTAEPTTTEGTEVYSFETMKAHIQSNGVAVSGGSVSESSSELDHVSVQSTSTGLAREMGIVAGGWANYIATHPDVYGDLYVTMYAVNGTPAGEYVVSTDDVRAYNGGELTSEEVSYNILNSLIAY